MEKGEIAFTSNFSFSHNVLTLSQTTILDSSKLKEFADDNFKFDEMAEISPFAHSVFKRLVLQTRKNQGLFGKGLKRLHPVNRCHCAGMGPHDAFYQAR